MSKRIFSPRKTQPEALPPNKPRCFYHNRTISHFCTKKKCTLPLCHMCLQIHKKQHIKNKQIPTQGIIQFESAQKQALHQLSQRKHEITDIDDTFKAKIKSFRNKIVNEIDQYINEWSEKLRETDGGIAIVKEIDTRYESIKKGSLPEIIQYYEDIHGPLHFRKLYKTYRGQALTNTRLDISQDQIDRIISVVKQAATQSIKDNFKLERSVPSISAQPHDSYLFDLNNQEQILRKNQSSKEILSENNIYTSFQSKQNSLKKRKGLSITKSDKSLNQPQTRVSLSTSYVNTYAPLDESKSNWRQFVILGGKAKADEDVQPIAEIKQSILNPKEMRDLIIKKKVKEQMERLMKI